MKQTTARGFTLIELLVVISIISLLVAILLPALASARKAARSTVCLSQQRQFYIPIANYQDDWDRHYPTAGYSIDSANSPNTPNWSGVVAYYIGFNYITEWSTNASYYPSVARYSLYDEDPRDTLLQCPDEPAPGYWNNSYDTHPSVSYGWNASPNGMGSNDGFDTSPGYDSIPQYRGYYGRVHEVEVLEPSTTVMTADYQLNATTQKKYEYHLYQLQNPDRLGVWHQNAGNALWVDGHASTIDYETLSYKTPGGSNFFDLLDREQ